MYMYLKKVLILVSIHVGISPKSLYELYKQVARRLTVVSGMQSDRLLV